MDPKETITAFISKSIPELCATRVSSRAQSSVPTECCGPENDLRWELNKKRIECENANAQISELQNKIENMRVEWRSQQEHLGKLHQDFTKLQHTLGEHSIYCATLGATMGSLLWKVSRMEGTIESILESNRINQMIVIMDNSLKAFIEVFGHDIPDPYGNEYQFILSWMGILTNVSACPDGRYFLLSKCEGTKLIVRLMEAIPKLFHPNGLLLQRMILMILYNLMINANGLVFMQNNLQITTILNKALSHHRKDPEIADLIFKLIYSLTQSAPSLEYFQHLKQTLPLKIIDATDQNSYSPHQDLAKKINNNLKIIENHYQMEKVWHNRPEEFIDCVSLGLSESAKSGDKNPSKKIPSAARAKSPASYCKESEKDCLQRAKSGDQSSTGFVWRGNESPINNVQGDIFTNIRNFRTTTACAELLKYQQVFMLPTVENERIAKEIEKKLPKSGGFPPEMEAIVTQAETPTSPSNEDKNSISETVQITPTTDIEQLTTDMDSLPTDIVSEVTKKTEHDDPPGTNTETSEYVGETSAKDFSLVLSNKTNAPKADNEKPNQPEPNEKKADDKDENTQTRRRYHCRHLCSKLCPGCEHKSYGS